MLIPLAEIIIDPKMRELCYRPYPNHPRGCPNFGRKSGCPPQCLMFDQGIDIEQTVFAIIDEFNLEEHVKWMQSRQPHWTQRQLECCLYWQPKARKRLEAMIATFLQDNPGYVVDRCPEAGGVNLTETLRRVGIILEWPPRKIVRKIALAGRAR